MGGHAASASVPVVTSRIVQLVAVPTRPFFGRDTAAARQSHTRPATRPAHRRSDQQVVEGAGASAGMGGAVDGVALSHWLIDAWALEAATSSAIQTYAIRASTMIKIG